MIGRRTSDSAFPDRQYSRCNHSTVDAVTVKQLTVEKWLRIFEEADRLGISFILLAGGEPMIRRDIIEAAWTYPNILCLHCPQNGISGMITPSIPPRPEIFQDS